MKKKKVLIGLSALGALTLVAPIVITSQSSVIANNIKSSNYSLADKLDLYSSQDTARSKYMMRRTIQGNQNIVTTWKRDPISSTGQGAKNEGRWMSHADSYTTGLFVRAGQKINVSLDVEGKSDYNRLVINAPNDWKGMEKTGRQWLNLKKGQNTVIPKQDGIIYVDTQSSVTVTIKIDNTNLVQVPVFYKGDDEKKFFEELKQTKSSVVNIVSHWMTGMYSVKKIKSVFLNKDGVEQSTLSINQTVQNLDNLVNYYTKISGLSLDGTGVTRRNLHNINIFGSRGSFGWANTGGIINIGENWSTDYLKGRHSWVLGHEVGHTWQNPNMSWNSVVETIPNIFTSIWQEKFHVKTADGNPWTRIAQSKGTITEIEERFKNVDQDMMGFKDFNTLGWPTQLTMFLQLVKGFGSNFWPMLSQYYRINNYEAIKGKTKMTDNERLLASEGLKKLNPWEDFANTADEEKQQVFMRSVMDVTGYNLVKFFSIWGLIPDPATETFAENLKENTKPIWNNYLHDTYPNKMIVQEKLKEYKPFQSTHLTSEMTIFREETKYHFAKRFKQLNKKWIPSNYVVSTVSETSTYEPINRRERWIRIHVYDPKHKMETQNSFWVNIGSSRKEHERLQFIPGGTFTDLIEWDVQKEANETGFLLGVNSPKGSTIDDVWLFDKDPVIDNHNYRYDSKTTKLKDGMVVRLILEPAFDKKFRPVKTTNTSPFDENDERIYLKANGQMVYEKMIRVIDY